MYRCLFVDLDDTLWDTFANNKESLEEVYAARPLWQAHFASFEAFFDIYYRINDRLWGEYRDGRIDRQALTLARFREPLAMGGYDILDAEIIEANAIFLDLTKTKTRTCPGAIDVLAYLHKAYQICVVSNGFGQVQRAKLQQSGLAPYVHHMVLSEDVGMHKPHRQIFDCALSLCRVDRRETLMIGDSWAADIVGAHNAGLDSVWYNPYRIDVPHHEEALPRYIITRLDELCSIL